MRTSPRPSRAGYFALRRQLDTRRWALTAALLVNLAGTAWLSIRFLRGRTAFHRLERWQTSYLPVFGLWLVTVVALFPPLFAFS